jgi:hypothetical protein
MPMNGQMNCGVNGTNQQLAAALLQSLAQQPNATMGMPMFDHQPQQMPMMMNGGGCPQQNGKQRNLTEGSQKSVKKNLGKWI